jgi:hypothetical protein
LLAVTLVLGGYWWGHSSVAVVHAQGGVVGVSKSYGKFVGTIGGMLIFEDDSGMLRFVQLPGGQIQQLVVRN